MTLSSLIPLLAILAVWYFLVLRPQQQERDALEGMIRSLQKDDRIVTIGGLHATIVEVGADTLVLELSPGARVTIDKSAVARKVPVVASAQAPQE